MFEIYGYGNVDALIGIFNAIAALRGSGDFLAAIAGVAVIGFFAALFAYALQPEKLHGWKWLATVIGVYYLLWVPTSTVQVLDKQGFQAPQVVANVPFGAAALGGLSSTIASGVTDMFETVFATIPGAGSMPNELSYSATGMMFGARAVAATSRIAFSNPEFRTNINNFVLNCTFYDLQEAGGIDPAVFNSSDDLWTVMSNTNPARFTPWIGGTATTNLVTCPTAWANLDSQLGGNVIAIRDRLAASLNPTVPAALRATMTDAQIEQAHFKNGLVASGIAVTNILRQNAMVNVINDAGMLGCQRANDPACMMQSQARANSTATTNAAWINGAKISEQALPLIRNAAEAMLYAMFPVVVLMLLLSSGLKTFRMLGLYVALFVSIQLWPPLFAILNYLGTQAASTQLAAAGTIVGGTFGVTLQNSDEIYANAVSMPAVVSYLVMSIPILAYSIANGLVGVSGALFGAVSGIASSAGSIAGRAATGSLSMGTIGMDQYNVSTSTSNALVSRRQQASGDWVTSTGDGRQAMEFLRNQGAASHVISNRTSQSEVTEASRSADTARSELFSAKAEVSSVLSNVVLQASSASSSTSRRKGTAVAERSEAGQAADEIRQWADQVQKTTGVDARTAMNIGFGLSGGIGTGKAPLPVKFNATGELSKQFTSTLSENEQKVAAHLDQDKLSRFKKFAQSATSDDAFLQSLTKESRDGKELSSRLSQSVARVESNEASYSEKQAFAERLATSYERGEGVSVDIAQLPSNVEILQHYQASAQNFGPHMRASLSAALNSHLAQFSQKATSSSGAALPTSFSSVKAANDSNLQDPALSRQRVLDTAASNNRAVAPRVSTSGLQPPDVPLKLQGAKRELQERTDSALNGVKPSAGFDQQHEIVRNPDGTVTSRKSQALGNLSQMGDEVRNLGSNALEVLQTASGANADDARKAAEASRLEQASSTRERAKSATPEIPTLTPKAGRRSR